MRSSAFFCAILSATMVLPNDMSTATTTTPTPTTTAAAFEQPPLLPPCREMSSEEAQSLLTTPSPPLKPLNWSGGGRSLLVTTLDGRVTMLNGQGQELWSVSTGELFSSTISSLQLSENGKWVNLIPSLTGSLYKYDSENLVQMPMTVDSLLHQSFKLPNEVVINGGKELKTFGIDLRTGRVRYECGLGGCSSPQTAELENEPGGGDPLTLVVKKQLQTVRAVDTQSGVEKWNFSVGTHEMGLTGLTPGCMEQEQTQNHQNSQHFSNLKVIIPEGRILSVDPYSSSTWSKQFSSPIAQAWILENGILSYVDPIQNTPLTEGPLALYVGRHKSQFYVQESRSLSNRLELTSNSNSVNPNSHSNIDLDRPRIAWRPSFVVNEDFDPSSSGATALTPFSPIGPSMRPFYVKETDELPLPKEENQHDAFTETEDDFKPPKYDFGPEDDDEENSPTLELINEVIIASLWIWWKEVLGISLLTAVLLNILLMRPLMRAVRVQTIRDMVRYLRDFGARDQQEGQLPSEELLQLTNEIAENSKSSETLRSRTISNSSNSNSPTSPSPYVELPEPPTLYFVSQYLREFEPIACLGRGGFGVVFEAKKRIDDRNYAVKRIPLPNREEARVRVMREVKALAQLDHRNIVRYFNAWTEHPPNGWLEKNDPLWASYKELGSTTPTVDVGSDFPASDFPGSSIKSKSRVQPLNEEEEEDGDSFIVFDEDAKLGKDFKGLMDDDESCLVMHDIKPMDVSEISYSGKGFWKRPEESSRNGDLSWDVFEQKGDRSKLDLDLSSSILLDSEGVEIGEDAFEAEESSIMYLYIQQELCQKRTLRDWLRSSSSPSSRPLSTVIALFGQIVDAVDYVHSKKLIHRDLKPSNIFLGDSSDSVEDHVIKIGDFGLATTVLAEVGVVVGDGTKLTLSSAKDNLTSQVGTQLYMSPEQFKRRPYDYKVDIYSLGLIFFELLVPFQTEMERHDILSKVRKLRIPTKFKEMFPQEHALIQRMISHNPNARPDASSISQWVKGHLRNFEGSGHDEPSQVTHRSNSSPAHIYGSGDFTNAKISPNKLGASDSKLKFHKSHSFTSYNTM